MDASRPLRPHTSRLPIADEARTRSVVPVGPRYNQMLPSAGASPTLPEQPYSGREAYFLAVEQQRKQVQYSEVEFEHKADETSEHFGVNVVRGSVEETTTTVVGAHVTEEGEVELRAWVVRQYAVFHEQLSVEVNWGMR